MKKYVALFGLSLAISSPSLAQEKIVEDDMITSIDTCTGMMSATDLIKASEELLKKGDETSDFFATNCIMIGAHKGDARSQYLLSQAYKDGIGAPMSNVYAYKWAKIADLNGEKISDEEFAKLESTMMVDDYRQASTEISNYLAFEKRNSGKISLSSIRDVLKDMNYDNISPEALAAIRESAENINALFDPDENSVEVKQKEAAKLKKNIVKGNASGSSKYGSERNVLKLESKERPEEEYIEHDLNEIRNGDAESSKPEEKRSSTGGKMPRSLDFTTDKFNPGFSPPGF